MRSNGPLFTAALALGAIAMTASTAWSQELDPGERVRVKTVSGAPSQVVGVVEARERDHIAVFSEQGTMNRIPWDDVSRLQVSDGYKSNAGKGALIGLGVGAVGGAAIVFIGCGDDSYCGDQSKGAMVLAFTASGAALGAGLGALIGMAAKSERWIDVPPGQWRIEAAPDANGGVAIGLNLRL